MAKMIKRGDEVTVISGEHKAKKGKVLEVLRAKNRIIIEGVNLVKHHERKTQDNPEGSIVEREASLHYSNIMLSSRHTEREARRT
jgi:large subunit ribosomal protein L24|tara:strand:- start:541 stop:795 length:255 start_codon:yes stop_codon:yes gene_type:complete